MNLDNKSCESKKERRRVGLAAAVTVGLMSHATSASSVEISAPTYEGGIKQYREGVERDQVETAGVYIETDDGKSGWYSFEGELDFVGQSPDQYRKGLSARLKELSPKPGSHVKLRFVHSHPLHSIRIMWPEFTAGDRTLAPPSLGFFDIAQGDTARTKHIVRQKEVIEPLEEEFGIHITVENDQVVDAYGIWEYRHLEIGEWRAQYPDLDELYILGTVIYQDYGRGIQKIEKDAFLVNRISEKALARGISAHTLLSEWTQKLSDFKKKTGSDHKILTEAENIIKANPEAYPLDTVARFFWISLIDDVMPTGLGDEIFGDTEYFGVYKSHQKIFEAYNDGMILRLPERFDELRMQLMRDSRTVPVDELISGDIYRQLVEGYRITGVEVTFTPKD